MTQPQSENQAAKKLQHGGVGYVMTVESPGARRPIRFYLHSEIVQTPGARTVVRRNRDGNGIFHNFDTTTVDDPKLHGFACGLGIQAT